MPVLLAMAAALASALPAAAQQSPAIGQLRTVVGQVQVLRAGAPQSVAPAFAVREADTVQTGPDGYAGIAFDDQTLVSLGPSSRLLLQRYRPAGGSGSFDATLQRGTLAVVAGRIARSSAEAMTVRTPNAVLGVRGTAFIVEVAGKP